MVTAVLPKAKIVEAGDGREALEALKGVEIAFVDMEMPEINGAEAVERAREAGARPFVTLMAQKAQPGWDRCSRDVEAYEFLEKPIEEEEIQQIIAGYKRMKEPCRVLVADASKTFRQLIRKVLAASRFSMGVDVVDNSELALTLLRQQPYDVIFLDNEMPGLDGFETACLIQEVSPSTRVVMMSASGSEGIEKAARYFGSVDFLRKPFYASDIDRALHLVFDLTVPTLLEMCDEDLEEPRPAPPQA